MTGSAELIKADIPFYRVSHRKDGEPVTVDVPVWVIEVIAAELRRERHLEGIRKLRWQEVLYDYHLSL